MKFKLMEELSIIDIRGVPNIYNPETKKRFSGEIIENELNNILEQFNFNYFQQYCGMKADWQFKDFGPAFIDRDGNYYYLQQNGYTVHADLIKSITKTYVEKKLSCIEDKSIVEEFLREFSFYSDLNYYYDLDYLTSKAELIRVNTGSSPEEDRFYTVIFSPLSRAQQMALEEVFEWGYKNNKEEVLIFCILNNGRTIFKSYDLEQNEPKEIVYKINRAFSLGQLLEEKEAENFS